MNASIGWALLPVRICESEPTRGRARVPILHDSRRRFACFAAAIVCALLLCEPMASPVFAAKFNRVVDINQRAPDWKDLPGIDGKRHSLSDHKDAKIVVVMFIRNNCPVAQAYEERIRGFVDKYSKQGVDVVAINVSREEGEGLEQMQTRAKKHKYLFPYLHDDSQQTGQAYGATNTPHVFVLDDKRRIVYMGAIDDNNDPKKVEEHFLIDAVEALLAGKPVEVEESLQRGCQIEYRK